MAIIKHTWDILSNGEEEEDWSEEERAEYERVKPELFIPMVT